MARLLRTTDSAFSAAWERAATWAKSATPTHHRQTFLYLSPTKEAQRIEKLERRTATVLARLATIQREQREREDRRNRRQEVFRAKAERRKREVECRKRERFREKLHSWLALNYEMERLTKAKLLLAFRMGKGIIGACKFARCKRTTGFLWLKLTDSKFAKLVSQFEGKRNAGARYRKRYPNRVHRADKRWRNKPGVKERLRAKAKRRKRAKRLRLKSIKSSR